MPYFCARLLFISLVDDAKPRKKNLYEYKFLLIKARGYEGAFRRALALGKQQETHYRNAKGDPVRWAFIGVEEVKKLPACLDGTEIAGLLDFRISDSAVPYNRRYRPRRSAPLFTE